MARKGGIDERPAVDGVLGAVGEEDGVFAAPAEARGADGERRALFFAELGEEAFDARPGFAGVVVKDEGDEAADCPDKVVSWKLSKSPYHALLTIDTYTLENGLLVVKATFIISIMYKGAARPEDCQ